MIHWFLKNIWIQSQFYLVAKYAAKNLVHCAMDQIIRYKSLWFMFCEFGSFLKLKEINFFKLKSLDGDETLDCLNSSVPDELPGIVFLSGGQSDIDATAHLDEMNKIVLFENPVKWSPTFYD